MKTGFGFLSPRCTPNTLEEAKTHSATPDQSGTGRRPTGTPAQDAGLLSKLKSRVSNKKSNFDLGLEEVLRQNERSPAPRLFRTPARENEAVRPGPGGRLVHWGKKLVDAATDSVVHRPAITLTEPGKIPSAGQVHRPEKDGLGRFKAKVADTLRPERARMREASSEVLNAYLSGKNRREALKEIGKRVRFGAQSAEAEQTAPAEAGESAPSAIARDPIDKAKRKPPRSVERLTRTDRRNLQAARDRALDQIDIARAYLRHIMWEGNPTLLRHIKKAEICDNPNVASVARRMRTQFISTREKLKELENIVQQEGHGKRGLTETSGLLNEVDAFIRNSHDELSREIAHSAVGVDEARALAGAIEKFRFRHLTLQLQPRVRAPVLPVLQETREVASDQQD